MGFGVRHLGVLCLGLFMGWLVRHFVFRLEKFTPKALTTIVTAVLGGVAAAFISRDLDVWPFYPIGLLGWLFLAAYFPKLSGDLVERLPIGMLGVRNLPAAASDHDMGAVRCFPRYRLIRWEDLLNNARSLDIVVCYFDSWVQRNWEHIVGLFKRGGNIRVFMTNPSNLTSLAMVTKRFPEHTPETITSKILETARHLFNAHQEAATRAGTLTIAFVDEPLNYSAVRIDHERVIMGIYEQYRSGKIDSPGFLFELSDSEQIAAFWNKEFDGFYQNGLVVSREDL